MWHFKLTTVWESLFTNFTMKWCHLNMDSHMLFLFYLIEKMIYYTLHTDKESQLFVFLSGHFEWNFFQRHDIEKVFLLCEFSCDLLDYYCQRKSFNKLQWNGGLIPVHGNLYLRPSHSISHGQDWEAYLNFHCSTYHKDLVWICDSSLL